MKRIAIFILTFLFIISTNRVQAQNDTSEVTFNIGFVENSKYYKKWVGRSFIYHNMVQYDDKAFPVPYPWQDGRVRSGKYKASPTALSNYINDFKKYNGKVFVLVKYLVHDDVPGVIFASEDGDSIFYSSLHTISAEFLSEDFVSTAKKSIGQKLIVRSFTTRFYRSILLEEEERSICQHRYEFLNTKTNEPQMLVPIYSEWVIKGIDTDYTFWGEKNIANTMANCFPRLQLIIENPRYGTMKIFANESGALCKGFFLKNDYWWRPVKYDLKDEDGDKVKNYGSRSEKPLVQKLDIYNSFRYPISFDFFTPGSGDPSVVSSNQPERFEKMLDEWCEKGYDEANFTKYIIYTDYYYEYKEIINKAFDLAFEHCFYPAVVLSYELPGKSKYTIAQLNKLYDKGYRFSDMGRIYINFCEKNKNTLSDKDFSIYESKAQACGERKL